MCDLNRIFQSYQDNEVSISVTIESKVYDLSEFNLAVCKFISDLREDLY